MKRYLLIIAGLFVWFSSPVIASELPSSNGEELYRQHCARCHGKLEKTRIPDRSARRITSAIKNLGVMGKLKNLTPEQIEEISRVLASEQLPMAGLN